MQIVKPGKLPDDDIYAATCNYCDCQIIFERKEAKYISDQRDGDSLAIECPTCKRDIWTTVHPRFGGLSAF